MQLFHVRRYPVADEKVPCFLIESTAPLNVDDPDTPANGIVGIDSWPAASLDDIARELKGKQNPELTVFVHGFNNPRAVVETNYTGAFTFVNQDEVISGQPGVFIGYRWPSSKLLAPLRSSAQALPSFGYTLLALGIVVLLGASRIDSAALYTLGGFILSVPIVLLTLRAAVYFRDVYRATHYGVPDLVEVIRQLDARLRDHFSEGEVRLSFIGHSMGAFVVTSVVRILSNVFDTRAIPTGDTTVLPDPGPRVGNVFSLARLVLVSPDIPAETLMVRRANFLATSLTRFQEAYLISNEGDVVLKLISTLANSFSFPTRQRRFGHRLGYIRVLEEAGVTLPREMDGKPSTLGNHLERLGLGVRTFATLQENLITDPTQERSKTPEDRAARCREYAQQLQSAAVETSVVERPTLEALPARFTYFDCTDYRQDGKAYLSRAKKKRRLGWWNNLSLLIAYLQPIGRWKVDVHSGYFQGPYTKKLIYRLACTGFCGLIQAPEGATPEQWEERINALSETSASLGIRVLLSPRQQTPPQ